jgi:hypothetical protein
MPHLEPTYLRYIYDGLLKGSIHPENAAELPEGLIGLYEEAFDERTSVVERQKLLERFAIWALLKKEVSAAFVAEVLGDTEDEIHDFISTYSAWFNSPESGKYQLYHERLKVYLLQKLSEKEIHELHERLILRLEKAIKEQKTDEFEWYGLEFLGGHLGVSAMIYGQSKKLIDLSYSQTHWQRQLKFSKGYAWTKNGLKEMMAWASKYNDDEVIECGLQMVDLHHQEQNAAPQIVALVAEGDFDSALKRIEQFGDNDKEGLQRKFILYMLCLMELTLLESKDKPFRKEGIEKLLKHLDEQLTVDRSILNWNDFFPSYTVFLMACEWVEMGLDYLIVNKRTYNWDGDWLKEKGLYTDIQFEVLLACARGISDQGDKSNTLKDIAAELAKQGEIVEAASAMQEALVCARGISDYRAKSNALKDISAELAKQGKIVEALECACGISHDYEKSEALKDISAELAKQGKIVEAASAKKEALECTRGFRRHIALMDISAELAKQGKIVEALACARGISDDYEKSEALKDISAELAEQGKILEALECARGISDDYEKSEALKDISAELAKQGKIVEALECARGISDDRAKSNALKDISAELAKQGEIVEALECARGISNDRAKIDALKDISAELAKQGKIVEALECARGISDSAKSEALKNISAELAKQGKIVEAASAMQEALKCTRGISDDRAKSNALKDISAELAKQGKIVEALECARGISNDRAKIDALKDISAELAKQGKIVEALECARGISDDRAKSNALKDISAELAKQGKLEEAASAMQEALECARGISDDYWKSSALKDISAELAKQGKIVEALECARGISDSAKSEALKDISAELAKQGKIVEALECARGISDDRAKINSLEDISAELAKQGKIVEALECARGISDDRAKINSLKDISAELAKQGKIVEAASAMQEALECTRGISDDRDKIDALMQEALESLGISDDRAKSEALKDISAELAKQGKIVEAASVMQEALECARGISDDRAKCMALNDISAELAKQGNFPLAEQIGLEIPFIADRQFCWKVMAHSIKEMHGWHAALEKVQKLQTEEARIYYLKGNFNSLTSNECNEEFILSARKFYLKDMVSMEKLFQNYALNELFFQENSGDKIERLNRTLNLQWAIDIKNQLPN